MAKAPTRSVSFYEQPCQIVVVNDAPPRALRGQKRTLTLPVKGKRNGKDVVQLPDGNEVEL